MQIERGCWCVLVITLEKDGISVNVTNDVQGN